MFETVKKSCWILTGFFNEDDTLLRTFHLNYGSNKIGRSLTNDIVIDNETVSKHHCVLWIESNDLPMIKDVGSKNGTMVQSIALDGVEDYILKENDTISLSGCEGGALFKIINNNETDETTSTLDFEAPNAFFKKLIFYE